MLDVATDCLATLIPNALKGQPPPANVFNSMGLCYHYSLIRDSPYTTPTLACEESQAAGVYAIGKYEILLSCHRRIPFFSPPADCLGSC